MSDQKNLEELYEGFNGLQTNQGSARYYDPMQGDISYKKNQVPTASPGGEQFSTYSPAPEMEEGTDQTVSKDALINFIAKLSEKINLGEMSSIDDVLMDIMNWVENN